MDSRFGLVRVPHRGRASFQEFQTPDGRTSYKRTFYKKGKHAVEMSVECKGLPSVKAFVNRENEELVFRHRLRGAQDFPVADICYASGGADMTKLILYKNDGLKPHFILFKFDGDVINVRAPDDVLGRTFVSRYSEDRVFVYSFDGISFYSSGANIDRRQVETMEVSETDCTVGVIFPRRIKSGSELQNPVDVVVNYYDDSWVNLFDTAQKEMACYSIQRANMVEVVSSGS